MNRDETKAAIAVMQHFADGGKVEFRCESELWVSSGDAEHLSWNWSGNEYRIKPEPLECWVWWSDIGGLSVPTATFVRARKRPVIQPAPDDSGRWVRMVEKDND